MSTAKQGVKRTEQNSPKMAAAAEDSARVEAADRSTCG